MQGGESIGPHVVFVGAGALGGFVGGMMAASGNDVSLIDAWPAHVDAIRRDGLRLSRIDGEQRVSVPALHIADVQALVHRPVDIAFICTKLYDTKWSTMLIAPYLAPRGFVVTMQNSLVEDDIASIVGPSRVLGCIASKMQVELMEPGHVRRSNRPGGDSHRVFRVGEIHGRTTRRVEDVVTLLKSVDSASATSNLWGERWSKLVANAMTSAVCAIAGLPFVAMYDNASARKLIVRLAAEAIEIGQALGFKLEPVFGVAPECYSAAARGDVVALSRLERSMRAGQEGSLAGGRSGIAQDLAKGRRTEIDYINGYIALRAREADIEAPANVGIAAMVRAIERGEARPDVNNLESLLRDLGPFA